MTTAVIGATGRVGGEVVRGLLARGDSVAALIRNRDKAREAFGELDAVGIRRARLDVRATLPGHSTAAARCSSQWDRAGSRESWSGSRSVSPRG